MPAERFAAAIAGLPVGAALLPLKFPPKWKEGTAPRRSDSPQSILFSRDGNFAYVHGGAACGGAREAQVAADGADVFQ